MLGGAAWQLCCHKHAHTRACARTRSLPRKPLCGLSVLQLLTQYSKLQRFQPVLHADAAPLEASVCMGGVGWWWCVGGEGGGDTLSALRTISECAPQYGGAPQANCASHGPSPPLLACAAGGASVQAQHRLARAHLQPLPADAGPARALSSGSSQTAVLGRASAAAFKEVCACRSRGLPRSLPRVVSHYRCLRFKKIV